MTLLWVVLWAVLVPGGLAASRFHERNHTGLIWGVDLTEGQRSPTPPAFAQDVTGNGYLGNLSMSRGGDVVWDVARQGFSTPSSAGGVRAVSQLPSESLLQHISSEMTLEFWFSSPTNLRTHPVMIAGMTDGPEITCAHDRFAWVLYSTLGTVIRFRIMLHAIGFGAFCSEYSVSVTENALSYIVVRARDGLINMRIAGSSSGEPQPTLRLDTTILTRPPTSLYIAPNHGYDAWRGSVRWIGMYDRFLETAEITTNRNAGPPNSLPVAAVAAAATNQDEAVALVL
jgi:hypothetical protein